jgi:menaquinol-cytochrome c reductase iron-sulfur subunit
MEEKKQMNRRQFMSVVTMAIGALISLGLGIPGIAYIVGPALQRQAKEEWIRLGSTTKVEPGTPTLFKAKIERRTGWIVNEEEISFYILTENGRDFIAMSNICTHLGCRVRWLEDQEQFLCPCHNAAFGKDGNVLSGPPPRPLDTYQVKIEEDQIYVLGGTS